MIINLSSKNIDATTKKKKWESLLNNSYFNLPKINNFQYPDNSKKLINGKMGKDDILTKLENTEFEFTGQMVKDIALFLVLDYIDIQQGNIIDTFILASILEQNKLTEKMFETIQNDNIPLQESNYGQFFENLTKLLKFTQYETDKKPFVNYYIEKNNNFINWVNFQQNGECVKIISEDFFIEMIKNNIESIQDDNLLKILELKLDQQLAQEKLADMKRQQSLNKLFTANKDIEGLNQNLPYQNLFKKLELEEQVCFASVILQNQQQNGQNQLQSLKQSLATQVSQNKLDIVINQLNSQNNNLYNFNQSSFNNTNNNNNFSQTNFINQRNSDSNSKYPFTQHNQQNSNSQNNFSSSFNQNQNPQLPFQQFQSFQQNEQLNTFQQQPSPQPRNSLPQQPYPQPQPIGNVYHRSNDCTKTEVITKSGCGHQLCLDCLSHYAMLKSNGKFQDFKSQVFCPQCKVPLDQQELGNCQQVMNQVCSDIGITIEDYKTMLVQS